MQWPMTGDNYIEVLKKIITENNIAIIIALGKQEPNQRVEMVSYWKTLGKKYTQTKTDHCIIRKVTGIPPKNTTCTIYQYPEWPDRGSPTKHCDGFDFLFTKIQEMEKDGKRLLLHCRAGVGRSGTLRLMYKAWKKELHSDGLVSAISAQRALRMWTVQTKLQYNFLQDYIRIVEDKERNKKSFEDIGGEAYDKKDYRRATFWFFKYQSYGVGMPYKNLDLASENCSDYRLFLHKKQEESLLPVDVKWETIEKLWNNRNQ